MEEDDKNPTQVYFVSFPILVLTWNLWKYSDFLLDVFDFIISLLQINNLNGHHIFRAVVKAFEYFTEAALADFVKFSEELLGV